PAPIGTVPVAATPDRLLRSATAPPVLNAATRGSASLCGILRLTVMVTGALADAPPAVLIAAVAVNTSTAPCPHMDAGVIDMAAPRMVAPIVLYVAVISSPQVLRLRGPILDSNPRAAIETIASFAIGRRNQPRACPGLVTCTKATRGGRPLAPTGRERQQPIVRGHSPPVVNVAHCA